MKKLFNITLCCGLALALSGCWKKKHTDAAAPIAEMGMEGKKDVAAMDAKKFEVAELESSAKSMMAAEKKIDDKVDSLKVDSLNEKEEKDLTKEEKKEEMEEEKIETSEDENEVEKKK